MIHLLFLFFFTTAGAQETRISLGEAREIFVAPSVGAKVLRASFENPSLSSDHAGAEIGLKIISSSNRARTLFVGFDLRQFIATRELYETKLGLNLEWQTSFANFSGAWFFGDTLFSRERDLQMNGGSLSLGISRWFGRTKLVAEASMGDYKEGPGFIYISRNSGPERLTTTALMIGIEYPLYAGDISSGTDAGRVRPTFSEGGVYQEPDL